MTAIDTLREHIGEHAVDLVRVAATITVQKTQDAASRRTGALADGISHSEPTLAGTWVVCDIVSAAPYSEYQDVGTGIYGPSGMRIFPTHAKALRFDYPAAGGIVFAKSVAGAPGRHFWHDALPARFHESLFEASGA
jgi:hypothetical protein